MDSPNAGKLSFRIVGRFKDYEIGKRVGETEEQLVQRVFPVGTARLSNWKKSSMLGTW